MISIQNCPMYHTVRNVREAEIFEIFTIKHQVAKISCCENFLLLKCFPDMLRKLSTLLSSHVFKDIELTSLCQRSINQTAENISGKQPMINLPFTSPQLQTDHRRLIACSLDMAVYRQQPPTNLDKYGSLLQSFQCCSVSLN